MGVIGEKMPRMALRAFRQGEREPECVVAVDTGTGLKYSDVPYQQPPVLQRDADLPIA